MQRTQSNGHSNALTTSPKTHLPEWVKALLLITFLLVAPRPLHAHEPLRWIEPIKSDDEAKADQACLKVFQSGDIALRDLLSLLDDKSTFNGWFMLDDFSADRVVAGPSVGTVALYLIHSILIGRIYDDPGPALRRADGTKADSDDEARLKKAYRDWVRDWSDGKVDRIRGEDPVIKGLKLKWTRRGWPS